MINSTHVYNVNNRLIIAKNEIEAINTFNEYMRSIGCSEEVKSLQIISDENRVCPSTTALIKEVTIKELKDWIVNNVRHSNLSDESLACKLHSFVYKNK